MPQTVVMSERLGAIGDEERRIEAAGSVLRSAPLWDPAEVGTHAGDADVIILGAVEPFTREVLAGLPNLKAVVRRGVGYDNVDVEAATELGIPVAIVPDASVEEVSDQAFALLLALERRIGAVDAAVHAGQWQRDPAAIQASRAGARRLCELTLGIVGLGRIGQALLRKAKPLYANIIASDPVLSAEAAAELGVELVSVEELSGRADHISLHAPLLPSTKDLVGPAFLARVRPGAIIVNTSRGGLVDQAAILEAVRDGRLGGAGLDVTVDEPLLPDDPLLGEPRILLTAHSASWSTTARRELSRRAVDAVLAVLDGNLPPVLANPDVTASPNLRVGGRS
jgi:phosphoglycerate dehydrogenase-like enzyme